MLFLFSEVGGRPVAIYLLVNVLSIHADDVDDADDVVDIDDVDDVMALMTLCRVLYMRFWAHQIEVQKVDCIDL
jgi:hypothetical protein